MTVSKARPWLILMFTLTLIALAAPDARAEIHPGVRIGGYFDAGGAFIGGEVLADLPWNQWYFNPNVEFVFADNANLVTFNFDVHYDLETSARYYFWIGGGPAILFFDPDDDRFPNRDSETDFGVNLFMGFGFNRGGSFIPYIQPKVILSENTEFALAFGVRF